MSSVVYQKLQEQLNQYSVGYPTTGSGIEIKILERLFTEEEAKIFLQLSMLPESSETIAIRFGSDSAQVDASLDEMSIKGLVYRHIKDGKVKYGAVPFIEGIWEYQVKGMDRELAQMFVDYVQEALHRNVTNTSPLIIHRPIAVNQTIVTWYRLKNNKISKSFLEADFPLGLILNGSYKVISDIDFIIGDPSMNYIKLIFFEILGLEYPS